MPYIMFIHHIIQVGLYIWTVDVLPERHRFPLSHDKQTPAHDVQLSCGPRPPNPSR